MQKVKRVVRIKLKNKLNTNHRRISHLNRISSQNEEVHRYQFICEWDT